MIEGHRIIVIAPCLNEYQKIRSVVQRVISEGFVDELVVVDDGSSDESAKVSETLGATVLRTGTPTGVGAAIRLGFVYAKPRCDIIVVIAGNNKDEPKEIPALVRPIIEERAEFVQGSRYLRGGAFGGDMPRYRLWATKLHAFLFSVVTGRRITDSTNGFRAFRTELLANEKIQLHQSWLNGYELEPYLFYQVLRLGYRTTEVPVTKIYPPKKQGYTKMTPLVDWWNILKPLLWLKLGFRS